MNWCLVWPAFLAPSGDSLARLLRQGNLGPGMLLAGCAVAFGLGALHALSPGHGKTIVAAYLVGSRSTARHAALLGLMVTATHTASVFFLGFVTLFLSRLILPEKLYPMLGTISGLAIVWIGGMLFFARLRAARSRHAAVHRHEASMGNVMALGASGGLVPCPSALVLLLSAVALGRVALGLTLLVAFSAGLAIVLMGIGIAALYARRLLPDKAEHGRLFRYLPVVSAAVIVVVGAAMTAVALGLLRVAI